MNKRIKELAEQAMWHTNTKTGEVYKTHFQFEERFAEMIVSAVLDEVNERVYYSGDRAWSDELDRKWIELEFGFGELTEIKNERTN